MTNLIQRLHERALDAARKYKQAESDLIEIFQEFDEAKAFIKLGYASLFEYGVKALGLSEANTYAFIQVARAAREVPALKAAIQTGNLTVSKAKRIAPVITPENQEEWLAKAQTLSKASLEKEIVRTNPEMAVTERSRYVTRERLELKLGVSEALLEKLKRIQDILSQKTQAPASLETALEEMAELFLEKNDPVRKAARAKAQIIATLTPPDELGPSPVRTRIPYATRHAVNARDQGQCTHSSQDGSRCDQRRWTQTHHKKPVSQGGSNDLSNLTTLCFQHHRFVHFTGKP